MPKLKKKKDRRFCFRFVSVKSIRLIQNRIALFPFPHPTSIFPPFLRLVLCCYINPLTLLNLSPFYTSFQPILPFTPFFSSFFSFWVCWDGDRFRYPRDKQYGEDWSSVSCSQSGEKDQRGIRHDHRLATWSTGDQTADRLLPPDLSLAAWNLRPPYFGGGFVEKEYFR